MKYKKIAYDYCGYCGTNLVMYTGKFCPKCNKEIDYSKE